MGCQKEEMNSKHAHDMVIGDLTDSIENSNKDIEEKTADKEAKKEKIAMDKKELAATIEMKKSDEHTYENLDTECAEKKLSLMRNRNCELMRSKRSQKRSKFSRM